MVEAKLASTPQRVWLLEQMRATFFFTAPTVWQPKRLLQSVTGQEPTQIQQPIAMSMIQESCPLGSGQFTIGQNANRIDVVLSAVPAVAPVLTPGEEQKPHKPQFIKLGPYRDQIPAFRTILTKLVGQLSGFSRLGVLPVVFCEGPGPDEIYKLLCDLFPRFGLEREGIEDFIWKTNRRRRSEIDAALWINRLTTWTVIQTQTLEMIVATPNAPTLQATPTGLFAVRVELDINTDHLRKDPLPNEATMKLLDELLSHAEGFMNSGDRQ